MHSKDLLFKIGAKVRVRDSNNIGEIVRPSMKGQWIVAFGEAEIRARAGEITLAESAE